MVDPFGHRPEQLPDHDGLGTCDESDLAAADSPKGGPPHLITDLDANASQPRVVVEKYISLNVFSSAVNFVDSSVMCSDDVLST